LYSLRSDISKSIENVVKGWKSSKSLEDQVDAVVQCITERDYLTVHHLGGGSSAVDIDVRILHALMKGINIIDIWHCCFSVCVCI